MKFDIALVNKAFQKSFAPMKNIVALVHMVVMALGVWLLSQLGMQLAIAVQSQIVVYVFMGITVIYAVVVFSSMAYFLYFFGLASVKSDKKAGLGDAISAL